MGSLYRRDLNKYKNYFKQAAALLGIDVQYQYLIKRDTESQSGESIYSGLSEPITQSVIIEQGNPKIDSLKQLGWFTDSSADELLVDFPVDTPNLQEGCRFIVSSNENAGQALQYVIMKLSSEVLYTTCIKCLCRPVLQSETTHDLISGEVSYGQQAVDSDDENYSFINEKQKFTFF